MIVAVPLPPPPTTAGSSSSSSVDEGELGRALAAGMHSGEMAVLHQWTVGVPCLNNNSNSLSGLLPWRQHGPYSFHLPPSSASAAALSFPPQGVALHLVLLQGAAAGVGGMGPGGPVVLPGPIQGYVPGAPFETGGSSLPGGGSSLPGGGSSLPGGASVSGDAAASGAVSFTAEAAAVEAVGSRQRQRQQGTSTSTWSPWLPEAQEALIVGADGGVGDVGVADGGGLVGGVVEEECVVLNGAFVCTPIGSSSGSGITYNSSLPHQHSLAVEFDTSSTRLFSDPTTHHVGINMDYSMTSAGHASVHPAGIPSLGGSGKENETLHAWVAYNATASLLSVRLSSSPAMPPSALLSLPFNACDLFHNAPNEEEGEGEAVLVHAGFAAGTGLLPLHTQTHEILSWSFQVDTQAPAPLPLWMPPSLSFPFLTQGTRFTILGSTRLTFSSLQLTPGNDDNEAGAAFFPLPLPLLSLLPAPSPRKGKNKGGKVDAVVCKARSFTSWFPFELKASGFFGYGVVFVLSTRPGVGQGGAAMGYGRDSVGRNSNGTWADGGRSVAVMFDAFSGLDPNRDVNKDVAILSVHTDFNMTRRLAFSSQKRYTSSSLYSMRVDYTAATKTLEAVTFKGATRMGSVKLTLDLCSVFYDGNSTTEGVIPVFAGFSSASTQACVQSIKAWIFRFTDVNPCTAWDVNPCGAGRCSAVRSAATGTYTSTCSCPLSQPSYKLPQMPAFQTCFNEYPICRLNSTDTCAPGVCLEGYDASSFCLCPPAFFPLDYSNPLKQPCNQVSESATRVPSFPAPPGLTCPLLLDIFDLSPQELLESNQDLACDKPIPRGLIVNVSASANKNCTSMYTANQVRHAYRQPVTRAPRDNQSSALLHSLHHSSLLPFLALNILQPRGIFPLLQSPLRHGYSGLQRVERLFGAVMAMKGGLEEAERRRVAEIREMKGKVEERERELASVKGEVTELKDVVMKLRVDFNISQSDSDTKEAWEAIKSASKETYLSMENYHGLSGDILEHVSSMTHLTSIFLGGSSGYSAEGITHLYRLPRLVELGLDATVISDSALEGIGSLTTLQLLFLMVTKTCGRFHTPYRCFSRLDDAWREEMGEDVERPRWAELMRAGVDIFALDYDAIIAAMYALTVSAEGDCYLCVPPDPGIEPAALGTSESALSGMVPPVLAPSSAVPAVCESALSGTAPTETALSGTAPAEACYTFTLDSVLAQSTTVLPCPAVPSGSLSGFHLPSFSTNLVSNAVIQDQWVDTFTPGGQRVAICTCSRTGRHLATFTRRPGSSLYTLTTASPQVAAVGQVSASGLVAHACECRSLSHQTLLWHHRLGHPSLPRLRGMHRRRLVSGLPRSLPPLPASPAPPCLPCVEGRQRAAPHSSSFPPTEAPLQTLHLDVWGPARVRGQGGERYFLLVVDDYSRYTTVFPLRTKGEVPAVLIPWIRTVRLQLRRRFRTDLPVLRLHSDRGGEFSSDLLRTFCQAEGIEQTFTLPDSPQQNGVAERRIGLVMEVARTSLVHAAAPHFLWPFAVRYAAHQLNLWPHVSLPETSPTLRWTGEVGDASRFRVWGARALVRDTSADKLSSRTLPCVFLGFVPDAPGWQFYHPTSRRVFASQDVTFDESVPFYRLFPYRTAPLPPPPLFLAPGPPPVDPLPPQGPAPSGVSQVDPPPVAEPVEVTGY
ncbi:unnamed protein product [Closterium sp. Yama58-4]|nr:unnamed protein product [Closterium sp. Yama58-4]